MKLFDLIPYVLGATVLLIGIAELVFQHNKRRDRKKLDEFTRKLSDEFKQTEANLLIYKGNSPLGSLVPPFTKSRKSKKRIIKHLKKNSKKRGKR